jgi:ABC-type transporter Mla maintaining outer membrane lipid asymmetry ATPase subunit MlaF
MTLNERIHQYADDLAQRKLLVENRITILKEDSSVNKQRIANLEAVKKNIAELQEIYFDYFYNELSGEATARPGTGGRGGEQSNVINLDEAMSGEDTILPEKPVVPDLSNLLNNIKNIQDKHRNE